MDGRLWAERLCCCSDWDYWILRSHDPVKPEVSGRRSQLDSHESHHWNARDWCGPSRRSCYWLFLFSSLAEIEKCEGDDLKKDGDMKKYLDIISNKHIKLSERVLIPVQQYPKVSNTAKLASW